MAATTTSSRFFPEVLVPEVESQITLWRSDGIPFHVLALVADADRETIPDIQKLFLAKELDLAGAIFPELIHNEEFVAHGLILLRISDAPRPLLLRGVADPNSPQQVANKLLEHILCCLSDNEDASMLCFFDSLTPNIASHLDAWYAKLADRIQYFGANAGNEKFQAAPCLFDNRHFVEDALLIQLLPGHPGAILEHAYGVPEEVVCATSAVDNRIIQIDWQPALAEYRNIIANQYGVTITRENFYQLAVHFPFGILRADGEVLVRIPIAIDAQDAIVCLGEIPPNSVLTLLDGRTALDLAVPALLAGKHISSPEPLLFYCAGRRLHAGHAATSELAALRAAHPGRDLLGALSLGEIGGSRAGGYPLFHNATLVDVPWPGR